MSRSSTHHSVSEIEVFDFQAEQLTLAESGTDRGENQGAVPFGNSLGKHEWLACLERHDLPAHESLQESQDDSRNLMCSRCTRPTERRLGDSSIALTRPCGLSDEWDRWVRWAARLPPTARIQLFSREYRAYPSRTFGPQSVLSGPQSVLRMRSPTLTDG